MPKDEFPGVFVEQVEFRAHPIEGVSTSNVAFVGFADAGPKIPTEVASFAEYAGHFGQKRLTGHLTSAVRGFFQNGGTRCFILRIPSPKAGVKSAPAQAAEVVKGAKRARLASVKHKAVDAAALLAPLESIADISMLCCPDEHAISGMSEALVRHCERMRYRIAILAAPPGDDLSKAPPRKVQSAFAAYYAPWITIENPPRKDAIAVHPGGHIAGVIAANDARRGVYKAPANLEITGIVGLERNLTEQQQEALNLRGVNVLRKFPGRGIRIWGARTASTDPEWKYINIRRYLIYLEQSIDQGTQWVVFEPNGEQLWGNVRRTIEDFLLNEWQSGALLGDKPEKAYFVRCDRTTMTQNDLDNGRLICLVGVAPVKPAEFVIFRIGQWTADHKPKC